MTLSASYTVNGVSNPATHTAAYSSTVSLALLSTTGAGTILWEIIACSKSGASLPTITRAGTPNGATATFPLPADPGDGLGRCYLVKCTVSNSRDTVTETAVVGAVNAAGLLPLVPGEELARDATHGWSQTFNQALASTATPVPTTLGTPVANIAALKAVGASDRVDNQSRAVGSPAQVWIYSTSTGSGFASDDLTVVKPTDVLLASNGRWYPASPSAVVPTIAALRLAVSGKQQTIAVQAYASISDGGGGTFDYDSSDTTTADDGGTIIVAGARRYKRRYTGSVSPRWFGAKADGTNDRAAITLAIAAALAHVSGGCVDFGSGKFTVDSTTGYFDLSSIPSTKRLLIRGDGVTSAEIAFTGGGDTAFFGLNTNNVTFEDIKIGGSVARTIHFTGTSNNIDIHRCTITGGNVKPSTGAPWCIGFTGSRLRITECDISGFGVRKGATAFGELNYGIVCGFDFAGVGLTDIKITKNYVTGTTYATFGIACFGSMGLVIDDNDVKTISGQVDNYAGGYGVLSYDASAATPGVSWTFSRRSKVTNNRIEDTAGFAVYCVGTSELVIAHNVLKNNGFNQSEAISSFPEAAIYVSHSTRTVTVGAIVLVRDNILRDPFGGGIAIQGEGIVCSSNHIYNAGTGAAIRIDGQSPNVQVTNNSIWGGGSKGIFFSLASYAFGALVAHNQINGAFGAAIEGTTWDGTFVNNTAWRCGGSGLALLGGSGNNVHHNNFGYSTGGYGLDVRGKKNHVNGNICRANINGGIVESGSGHYVHDNNFEKNGLPAIITGTVDLTGLTYPFGVGASFTAGNDDTSAQTMSIGSIGAYNPEQLCQKLNESNCAGMTWYINSTHHLVLVSLNGGTTATLGITANATTAALGLTVNAVTNRSATGSAPAVADATLGGTACRRHDNIISTGVVESTYIEQISGAGTGAKGLWNVKDTGTVVPSGGWLTAIHQTSSAYYGFALFDDNTSTTVPGAKGRAVGTTLFLEATTGFHFEGDTVSFFDSSGNPHFYIRNTGTGPGGVRGCFAEASAGAWHFGQDAAATANDIYYDGQNATAGTGGNVRVRAPTGSVANGTVMITDAAGNIKLHVGDAGIGFHGVTPSARPTVTGSRASGAALTSLLTELHAIGVLTDGTSA